MKLFTVIHIESGMSIFEIETKNLKAAKKEAEKRFNLTDGKVKVIEC